MPKTSRSFENFWPRYVRAHAGAPTRRVHALATGAGLACVALGLLSRHRWLLLLAPLVSRPPTWLSHLLFEKNRPDDLDEPVYAVLGDLMLLKKTLFGTMQEDLERFASPPVPVSQSDVRPNMVTDHTLH